MKKWVWGAWTVVFVLSLAPGAMAQKFAFEDYGFVWNVAREGGVTLSVQKDPGGLQILLGSRGGKVATVSLTPAEAVAVGEILLKTDSFHDEHRSFYVANQTGNKVAFNQEKSDTVKTDTCQVVFRSAPKGQDFSVRVGKAKTFTTMALMSREEALKMGALLVKGQAMAKFVNGHLKF